MYIANMGNSTIVLGKANPVANLVSQIANGQWSVEDTKSSSTWHELRAVKLVLESFQ